MKLLVHQRAARVRVPRVGAGDDGVHDAGRRKHCEHGIQPGRARAVLQCPEGVAGDMRPVGEPRGAESGPFGGVDTIQDGADAEFDSRRFAILHRAGCEHRTKFRELIRGHEL